MSLPRKRGPKNPQCPATLRFNAATLHCLRDAGHRGRHFHDSYDVDVHADLVVQWFGGDEDEVLRRRVDRLTKVGGG